MQLLIYAACIVCRVYVTVRRAYVRPVDQQLQRRPVGLLLTSLRAGDIDR